MAGGSQALNVLVSHQDQVVRPPDGAVVLAGSDFCPNAMLRIGDRILTMQGHPEMNVPTVDRLLDMRRERVGEDDYARGKRSDRKSVVRGESVSVRVDLGGRRILKKKQHRNIHHNVTDSPT